jgi:hypothetical protein
MKHWTMDDIPWTSFRPDLVDPALVPIIKAASIVEYNARDYTRYLRAVFADDAELCTHVDQWGEEETQHGEALQRWAKLADPAFDFDASFQRFITGYQQLPAQVNGSVRGSRTGELIARCVVEMGTSSYYTAIKEQSAEPVLQAIAARIAADELRHYKLFYTAMQRYREQEKPSLWKRLRIALGRVVESEDDELAYAYYAANASTADTYDRKYHGGLYMQAAYRLYHRHHVERMAAMLFKAVGLKPHTRIFRVASALAWQALRFRTARA